LLFIQKGGLQGNRQGDSGWYRSSKKEKRASQKEEPKKETPKKPAKKKSNEEIAKEVIAGKWGNGEARKKKLKAAGYDYDAVQKIVNKLAR
jgi:hypothetical protein